MLPAPHQEIAEVVMITIHIITRLAQDLAADVLKPGHADLNNHLVQIHINLLIPVLLLLAEKSCLPVYK